MEYRYLGNSGLQLSAFAYGPWFTFGNGRQVDKHIADRLMSQAYDLGINYFDNAEVYGHGKAEEMMGRILKEKQWERSSYILSSKVYYGIHGSRFNKPNQMGLSRKHIIEACHAALKRLDADYLDLYFCHRPDENVPMEEIVRTMNALIRQGKILYWGTSEWSGADIMAAHAAADALNLEGPIVGQPRYNMFDREKIEKDYESVFRRYNMGITTYSPLMSGILTGKYNEGIPEDSRLGLKGYEWLRERELKESRIKKVRNLMPLAKDLGISMTHLALAWIIQNKKVHSVILGASKPEQIEDNVKALSVYNQLTPEINQEINDILDNKPIIDKRL